MFYLNNRFNYSAKLIEFCRFSFAHSAIVQAPVLKGCMAQFLDKLKIDFLVSGNKINAKKALCVQGCYLRSRRKKAFPASGDSDSILFFWESRSG